jgi:hypothetical protein
VGEELIAIEEPAEQLSLLETQPIERTFYSEQHNDLAYLPKVSVNMLGQTVSYAVLMQGVEFVDENGDVAMEYTVTAVDPIDTIEDENTADYSAESNSLDVPVVDVVDDSGAIVAFKVTLETVSTDPLIFRIKLSQVADDTAATDDVVADDTVTEDTTVTDDVVADDTVTEDTTVTDDVVADDTVTEDTTVTDDVVADDTVTEDTTVTDDVVADDTVTEDTTVTDDVVADDTATEDTTVTDDVVVDDTVTEDTTVTDVVDTATDSTGV